MNLDFSLIVENITDMFNTFLAYIPQLVLGLIIVLITFFVIARLAQNAIKNAVEQSNLSAQAATAIARLVKWGVIILGTLFAVTVVFPSVDIATLLGTLGVTGVAIGFAFQDVLQNFFAGLILLISEPFKIGDQVAVNDYEGTVKQIETRATTIHTYDGRDVVIPNAELFTNAVVVNTAHNKRRSQYDIGIGYGDDIDMAKQIMLETARGIKGVVSDPEPDALVVALADFSVNIRLRWWTEAERADVIKVQDRVLSAVKNDLVAAGIDLPFPTRQILFHDQTEETDGDRARQREGWPVSDDGITPEPRRIVDGLKQLVSANGSSDEEAGSE